MNDVIYEKFKSIFGVDLDKFNDRLISYAMGVRFNFDIILFEEYYKKNIEYFDDGEMSFSDAVNKKFGEDGVNLIKFLLMNYYMYNGQWCDLEKVEEEYNKIK